MFCTGFAGLAAPRAVSDDCRQSEGEKGVQSMLQLLSIFAGDLLIISMSPVHLADIFSSLDVARVDFLGSGWWRGRRESRLSGDHSNESQ